MMCVEHLGKTCDAVIELRATCDVTRPEHILAEDAPAVTHSGQGAHADEAKVFETRNVVLQKCVELLHELMLLENLARDILRIGVMAIVAMEGEGDELRVFIRCVRNEHAEEAFALVTHVPSHLAALDGFLLQDIDQGQGVFDTLLDLLLAKRLLGSLVGLEIRPCPAGPLRSRHVQSGKILATDLKRRTSQCGKIAVSGAIDVDSSLHAHHPAFSEEHGGIDFLVAHLDVN